MRFVLGRFAAFRALGCRGVEAGLRADFLGRRYGPGILALSNALGLGFRIQGWPWPPKP